MVLIIAPAIDGLKQEWREAAENLGATPCQYWRNVALPILWPTLLGTMILLFANAFGAHATAYALTGGSLTIVPIAPRRADPRRRAHNPDLGYALAMGMIVIMAGLDHRLHGPAASRGALATMKRRRTRSELARLVDRLPARRPLLLPAAARHLRVLAAMRQAGLRGLHDRRSPTRSSSRAFGYSLVVAIVTIIVSVVLIVPTAYWVRLRLPRLRPVVEFITLLPFVIPADRPRLRAHPHLQQTSPLPLTDTDIGSNAPARRSATSSLSLPYMYRAVDTGPARRSTSGRLTEAAQSLGAELVTIMSG